MVKPTLSYLICSTPRSGTTLLCEALTNTGIAGRPEEYYQHRRKTGLPRRPREYFEDRGETPEIARILGTYSRVDDELALYDPRRFASYREYLDWTIEAGTTPNGVFGAKVMWGYFNGFVDRLRDVEGNAVMSTRTVLERRFPNLRGWVLLVRRDKASQAVSLWKAMQTDSWRRDAGEGRPVEHHLEYSFDALDRLVAQFEEHEDEWRRFFDDHGVEPFAITYEDVVADYEGSALAIIRHLGIDVPGGLEFGPRKMRKQADARSAEWVRRYHEDREAARTAGVGRGSPA